MFLCCVLLLYVFSMGVCASHLPRMASFISDTKLQLPEPMLHIATLKADKITSNILPPTVCSKHKYSKNKNRADRTDLPS